VSRLNHGAGLHETLLAPFIRKVLDRDTSGLAALYHRIAWLPLFWPETLVQALDGATPAMPATRFGHPVGEPVAALVSGLMAELRSSPQVTLHHATPTRLRTGPFGCTLEFQQCGPITTRRLAWAATPAQALTLAGQPSEGPTEDRLSLLVAFLRLPRAALITRWSVMHVIDPSVGVYRVTDASANAGVTAGDCVDLALEANPDWFARVHPEAMKGKDDSVVLRAMVLDLVSSGLVVPSTQPVFGHLLRLRGALPLPTAHSVRVSLKAHERLKGLLPSAALLGPAAGPFVGSLADQVVQGLSLAAEDPPDTVGLGSRASGEAVV
jgi:hypothetical protein